MESVTSTPRHPPRAHLLPLRIHGHLHRGLPHYLAHGGHPPSRAILSIPRKTQAIWQVSDACLCLEYLFQHQPMNHSWRSAVLVWFRTSREPRTAAKSGTGKGSYVLSWELPARRDPSITLSGKQHILRLASWPVSTGVSGIRIMHFPLCLDLSPWTFLRISAAISSAFGLPPVCLISTCLSVW